MAKLIGSAPNQISTNGDLGSMAFEDKKNYATTSSPIYQPYRNIIINGDMSIAQRGTSFTGLTNGGSAYTIDRWKYEESGSTSSVFTLTQDSDVPSGQGFAKSLKMDCTTADTSIGTSDIVWLMQRVEAQNLQYLKFGTSSAESLTLSFWTKSNKTGTYAINIYQDDNAYNRTLNYTISSANTWEKKTITFSGNTTNAPSNDNGRGFWVNFTLIAGTQFTSTEDTSWHSYTDSRRAFGHNVNLADSTSNEWYVTGVQLEAGETASDFEFLPVDVNLQRCQRYYQVLAPGGVKYIPIVQYQAGFRSLAQTFPTEMRTAPTFTVGTYSGFTSFNGSDITANTIHAYEDVSYTVATSLIVREVKLDAEL